MSHISPLKRKQRKRFESAIASMLTLSRHLTGQTIKPISVGFTANPPQDTSEYRRVLGCPVLFSQKENFIILDQSIGSIPVLSPNPELLAYFENYAKEYLCSISESRHTSSQVIKLIMARLDYAGLGIRSVARELGMSVRTLQKQLETEGTTFSELLTKTRHDLSLKYLQDNFTVEKTAYMLGYADTSSFSKAFKKINGISPLEYRKQHQDQ